jgi:hypothetical protein
MKTRFTSVVMLVCLLASMHFQCQPGSTGTAGSTDSSAVTDTAAQQPEPTAVTKPNTNIIACELQEKMVREAWQKTKSNTLMLEIYPLKLSSDAAKKDFDMLILFRDSAKGTVIYESHKMSNTAFEKETANYISFLKARQQPLANMPAAYQMMFKKEQAEKLGTNPVYINIASDLALRTGVSQNDSSGACCKCPPLCAFTAVKSGVIERMKVTAGK